MDSGFFQSVSSRLKEAATPYINEIVREATAEELAELDAEDYFQQVKPRVVEEESTFLQDMSHEESTFTNDPQGTPWNSSEDQLETSQEQMIQEEGGLEVSLQSDESSDALMDVPIPTTPVMSFDPGAPNPKEKPCTEAVFSKPIPQPVFSEHVPQPAAVFSKPAPQAPILKVSNPVVVPFRENHIDKPPGRLSFQDKSFDTNFVQAQLKCLPLADSPEVSYLLGQLSNLNARRTALARRKRGLEKALQNDVGPATDTKVLEVCKELDLVASDSARVASLVQTFARKHGIEKNLLCLGNSGAQKESTGSSGELAAERDMWKAKYEECEGEVLDAVLDAADGLQADVAGRLDELQQAVKFLERGKASRLEAVKNLRLRLETIARSVREADRKEVLLKEREEKMAAEVASLENTKQELLQELEGHAEAENDYDTELKLRLLRVAEATRMEQAGVKDAMKAVVIRTGDPNGVLQSVARESLIAVLKRRLKFLERNSKEFERANIEAISLGEKKSLAVTKDASLLSACESTLEFVENAVNACPVLELQEGCLSSKDLSNDLEKNDLLQTSSQLMSPGLLKHKGPAFVDPVADIEPANKENLAAAAFASHCSSVVTRHASALQQSDALLHEALLTNLRLVARLLNCSASFLEQDPTFGKWNDFKSETPLDKLQKKHEKHLEAELRAFKDAVAESIVTLVERRCRSDCVQVVASLLGFTPDQRLRAGLDKPRGLFGFFQGGTNPQARAQHASSFGNLLNDFVTDETS